jgi:aminoglycoside phosphotransferase (APT) family kinase protein
LSEPTEYKKFEKLVQQFEPESRLVRVWELEGGVSAQVTGLEIERPDGRSKKLVVRRHGTRDLQDNPNIAADEFRLLQITRASGLPTPTPLHLDQSCEIFSTPCIVLEYIEGVTVFAPSDLSEFIREMAAQLSTIHSVDCSNLALSFLPKQSIQTAKTVSVRPEILDESIGEGRIRDALESLWPWTQRNESALLHGDFWPGNILWKDGQLAAVIDWEDARTGDPVAELADSRLEILWAFGIDAMNDFTDLPYWDLYAALRPAFRISDWAKGDVEQETMRQGHRLFVGQAFENLRGQLDT